MFWNSLFDISSSLLLFSSLVLDLVFEGALLCSSLIFLHWYLHIWGHILVGGFNSLCWLYRTGGDWALVTFLFSLWGGLMVQQYTLQLLLKLMDFILCSTKCKKIYLLNLSQLLSCSIESTVIQTKDQLLLLFQYL
jgi:hypothetical protein